MYGQIIRFHNDIGYGVIDAENGRKYRFAKAEIVNSSKDLVGQNVDFIVNARRPCQIIMMAGSPWTAFGNICTQAANDQE
jgi:hypothetical protein